MNKIMQSLKNPTFLICIMVMALAAGGKSVIIKKLNVFITKFPIELIQPFNQMDKTALIPYEVINENKIQNKDVLESLGTEEYLQWLLEDTDATPNSSTRYCQLFITYYTGNPDVVPHVPDECYSGGGNRFIGSHNETIMLNLTESLAELKNDIEKPYPLDVQRIEFGRLKEGMDEDKFNVLYFFKTNGKVASSRTATRTILGQNFFSKYSYFSKIEWKFYGHDFSGIVHPNTDQVLGASEKLLSLLLPVLEKDHWPNWEQANKTAEKKEN